jgi:hypothetical protein
MAIIQGKILEGGGLEKQSKQPCAVRVRSLAISRQPDELIEEVWRIVGRTSNGILKLSRLRKWPPQ